MSRVGVAAGYDTPARLRPPVDQLQQQVRGSVVWQPITLEHSVDTEFKAGLYTQVKAFAAKDFTQFCTLATQRQRFVWYEQMAGYRSSIQESSAICLM